MPDPAGLSSTGGFGRRCWRHRLTVLIGAAAILASAAQAQGQPAAQNPHAGHGMAALAPAHAQGAASRPAGAKPGQKGPAGRATQAAKPAPLVDINSAGLRQLKTLPGIGDAEARRIIAGRPYLTKADLATRQVLPTGVYISIRHHVVALQKQPLKAGNPARNSP